MWVYLLAAAICFVSAIAGTYVGAAQVLHWPLSEMNTIGAVAVGAIVFGIPGSAVTIFLMALVKPNLKPLILVIGSILTFLVGGAVSFIFNAMSAAC